MLRWSQSSISAARGEPLTTRHFKVKAVKRRKLQQKLSHRQVEAAIDGRFKVQEHLAEGLRHELRAKALSAGHAPHRDGDPQRMSDRFLQDTAELAVRHSDARLVKKRADIVAVEEQRVGVQHRHQSRVLKRHQAARRHSARKQHVAPLGIAVDQGAERPVVFLALQMLQVVNEQNIPASVRRRERKAGLARRQAANALFPLQQLLGHHAFAKAAGRGKKQHSALLHHLFKRRSD